MYLSRNTNAEASGNNDDDNNNDNNNDNDNDDNDNTNNNDNNNNNNNGKAVVSNRVVSKGPLYPSETKLIIPKPYLFDIPRLSYHTLYHTLLSYPLSLRNQTCLI